VVFTRKAVCHTLMAVFLPFVERSQGTHRLTDALGELILDTLRAEHLNALLVLHIRTADSAEAGQRKHVAFLFADPTPVPPATAYRQETVSTRSTVAEKHLANLFWMACQVCVLTPDSISFVLC